MKYIRNIGAALCFSFGLCIAGSDGPLFPWINFLGIVILGLTPIIMKGGMK
jgi:hypothetical protein